MFEELIDPSTCGELTPAAMVDAIGAFHRAEATMVAHKLTLMACLLDHQKDNAADEEKFWAYDPWAAVRDQVAPAMRLSSRRASTQMRLAEGLARYPKIAALLAAGVINTRVVETLIYRTELLLPAVQGIVDAEIARQAGGYTLLSDEDLILAVDAIIEEHDPDAVRRYREAAKGCEVGFGKRDDATGTASLYGRISAADAELGWRVLNALAGTVCKNDPRSKGELRAAAMGAVYRRQDRLSCQCGDPTCEAATLASAVPSAVIHVLAEQGALEHVLAQIEELRAAHPTDSDVVPPTIDYEALAREADAAEASYVATPPPAPPWETPSPASEPEPEPEPEPEVAVAPEPEPAVEGGEPAWSHWFTPDTDTDDGEPPWAHAAPASEAGNDDPIDGDQSAHTIPTPAEPPTTDAETDGIGTDEPEPADDDGDDGDGDGDDRDDDPPWDSGGSPPPPPQPSGPDTGGSTAATPDPEPDQGNKTAPEQDSPSHKQQTPLQTPAAFTPPRRPRPAVTLGGTLIPLDQLAAMLCDGATVTALPIPPAAPAAGYKFTGTARDFIQCRDLRCRFPGCNRKAEYADIDHTIPHGDHGETHPSNGKALCREHHLVKTFGEGWCDEQSPNGEVRWTAPTGHTYVTQPSTRVLFPDWDSTTATLPPPPKTKRRKPTPGITMPLRKHTRDQEREQHINTEREYNALQRALGKPARRPPF